MLGLMINAYFSITIMEDNNMTDTKLGKAFRQYAETNTAMIRWIMGITLVEIAFVFSQGYYKNIFFLCTFLGLSGVSFLISVLIMFFITKQADSELHSALLAEEESMSLESFDKAYAKRMGKISAKLSNFIINHHLIKWLFISFVLSTINVLVLILTQADFVIRNYR